MSKLINPKNKSFLLITLIIILAFTGGCNTSNDIASQDNSDIEGLKIVTSISILANMAENVVGDKGHIVYIVPRSDNPEDHEMLPSELQKIINADVFFMNGWGLESSMERVLDSVTNTPIISLTEGITPIPLVGDDAPDPHAWLDASLAIIYIENIRDTLITLDPDNEEIYRKNAEAYIEQLKILDDWIREQVNLIPEENRIIVVSENAFKYYGAAYGFQTEGIWELNAHEEGTPQQISRIVNIIRENNLPAVFVETTVNRRYMQIITNETGVPIAGEIYTDALGHIGSNADTYIGLMKHNTEIFVKGLR